MKKPCFICKLHVAADQVGCCCVLCDLHYHVICLDSMLLFTPFEANWTCFQCIKLNLPFADVDVIDDYDHFNLYLNMEKQNLTDKYLDTIDNDGEERALLNEAGLDADLNFYNIWTRSSPLALRPFTPPAC